MGLFACRFERSVFKNIIFGFSYTFQRSDTQFCVWIFIPKHIKEEEDSLWVGWPVTLTPVFSEVMPDCGSLQIPIWSQRLLAVISSPRVHIRGKSTKDVHIPRMTVLLHRFRCEKYLRQLQEAQRWWRKTASKFTVKGLLSLDDNHFQNLYGTFLGCYTILTFVNVTQKTIGGILFWSSQKMYAWKGVIGHLKTTSSYEWMSWFGLHPNTEDGAASLPQLSPPPEKP